MFCTSKAGAKTSSSARFNAICLLVVYDTLTTAISQERLSSQWWLSLKKSFCDFALAQILVQMVGHK